MDMILTIGIFTSLFFCLLLLSKRSRSLPDGILAIWMLVIGIHLLSYYIYSNGYWEIYPHLIGITVPFPFFYGPLLYLYVKSSLKNLSGLTKIDYLHFLPIILTYIYMFRFYFFYSAEEKKLVDQGVVDDFSVFGGVLLIGYVLSAIAYAVYSYILLNRYKVLLENNFSNTENINLSWLKSFIWGVAILFFTVAIVLLSRDVFGIAYPFNADFIFYTIIVFGILCLGFFGIRHENIFVNNEVVEVEEKSKPSYKNSSLKEDYASDKHKMLVQKMQEEKPYLESSLTLSSLAELIDISPHHLSQIINQFEGLNFNDFVNKYRVEEFIERAKKEPHYSFFALALDSGFNSKSTFNAVFRKHKGITPSQFLSENINKD